MHRGELASPFDPAGREISKLSSKRKKTPDDHWALAKAEWYGSLYLKKSLAFIFPLKISSRRSLKAHVAGSLDGKSKPAFLYVVWMVTPKGFRSNFPAGKRALHANNWPECSTNHWREKLILYIKKRSELRKAVSSAPVRFFVGGRSASYSDLIMRLSNEPTLWT